MSGFYLALYRDRGDHRHHAEDAPLIVTTLPESALTAGFLPALQDAAYSITEHISEHPDVLIPTGG